MALATKACLHSAKKKTSLRWPVFSVSDEKVKTDASILDLSRQSHFDCVLFILLQLA